MQRLPWLRTLAVKNSPLGNRTLSCGAAFLKKCPFPSLKSILWNLFGSCISASSAWIVNRIRDDLTTWPAPASKPIFGELIWKGRMLSENRARSWIAEPGPRPGLLGTPVELCGDNPKIMNQIYIRKNFRLQLWFWPWKRGKLNFGFEIFRYRWVLSTG